MLTEQFVASVGTQTRPPGTSAAKDAAIFIQEYQPFNVQRTVFKKSATPPNCLAVSDSHIFAAQAERAVVNVYNREKGNQEATVPFAERITCIALACDDSVLVLGTQEGRIFLWEVASGRLVTTSQSHLQAVTALAVDPSSNFLLSASADSTVHVWSIPALLSFATSAVELPRPIRTFTTHRSRVNALVLGHGVNFCNIAVSVAVDKTCLVWDYFTNNVLRTYLLPSEPVSLALDAADRAIYVGYQNGSIQQLDLFHQTISGGAQLSAPIQPPTSSLWTPPDSSLGAALCLNVSFDGCTLISGHESGAIFSWDVARGGPPSSLLQNALPGPVTNVPFQPVSGFAAERQRKYKIREIVKPKFGAFDSSGGTVPYNYQINVDFTTNLPIGHKSQFEEALYSTSIPAHMMDSGLNELLNWGKGDRGAPAGQEAADDFMALDTEEGQSRQLSLEEQNASLRAELEALRRLQRASFDKLDKVNAEKKALMAREQKRLSRGVLSDSVPRTNGNGTGQQAINASDVSSDED